MSRYSSEVDREETAIHLAARSKEGSRSGGSGSKLGADLAALLDEASDGKPTMSQFVDGLATRGIRVVPSFNARGLNGMSYHFRGRTVRGSDIGREYTALGLQKRKGVQYSPERDGAVLRRALEPSAPAEQRRSAAERDRSARFRDQRGGLSRDQWATLMEVGRFRIVSARDLVRYRYAGDEGQFEEDVRVLRDGGLVERKRAAHPESTRACDVLVLTPKGVDAARRATKRGNSAQAFYAGFVKPTEIRHDVGIYRMYQQEKTRIESEGGRVTRIVMDFEIKKRLMSELNKRGEDPRDPARKSAIAARNGIALHNGRFVIPDVRVEYETHDRESERVDLELATADYKASQIAAKNAAGLKIYGPDSASGGTPWEPDYSLSLLSI